LGSTRLDRPDEEQLASTTHADTTAMPRVAPKTRVGRLILIRPDNHSTGRTPVLRLSAVCSPMRPIPASTGNISQPQRGGNGESTQRAWGWQKVVNQSLWSEGRHLHSDPRVRPRPLSPPLRSIPPSPMRNATEGAAEWFKAPVLKCEGAHYAQYRPGSRRAQDYRDRERRRSCPGRPRSDLRSNSCSISAKT
jgi:hypothetical protein